MQLGFEEEQAPFEGATQRARIWTEKWTGRWLYCPNCNNDQIDQFENNRPAADFFCKICKEQYEVKSTKGKFGPKVVDGAFATLCQRLESETNPNFAFLSYSSTERTVRDLFVIPRHFVSSDKIEKRKPLAPTARRAGWVGCNILLGKIPSSGKIFLVRDGVAQPAEYVRSQWHRTLFLRQSNTDARGWLVDVMSCCEALGAAEFAISDVYAFETTLKILYPGNRHIKEKIRQQLQVLRDNGYLEFLARGRYRLL